MTTYLNPQTQELVILTSTENIRKEGITTQQVSNFSFSVPTNFVQDIIITLNWTLNATKTSGYLLFKQEDSTDSTLFDEDLLPTDTSVVNYTGTVSQDSLGKLTLSGEITENLAGKLLYLYEDVLCTGVNCTNQNYFLLYVNSNTGSSVTIKDAENINLSFLKGMVYIIKDPKNLITSLPNTVSTYDHYNIAGNYFARFGIIPFIQYTGGIYRIGTISEVGSLGTPLNLTSNKNVQFYLDSLGRTFLSYGKTAYTDDTNGIWLGYESGAYKLYIGNTTTNLKWTGTSLSITGSITVDYSTGVTGSKPPTDADNTNSAIISGTTITGGGIYLSSGGALRTSAKTSAGTVASPNTTAGIYVGYDTSAYKIMACNTNFTKGFLWDGTDLVVKGDIDTTGYIYVTGYQDKGGYLGGVIAVNSKNGIAGENTASGYSGVVGNSTHASGFGITAGNTGGGIALQVLGDSTISGTMSLGNSKFTKSRVNGQLMKVYDTTTHALVGTYEYSYE